MSGVGTNARPNRECVKIERGGVKKCIVFLDGSGKDNFLYHLARQLDDGGVHKRETTKNNQSFRWIITLDNN